MSCCTFRVEGHAEIILLATSEHHRQQGYAKRIVRAVCRYAAELQFEAVVASVQKSAQGVFEKMQFSVAPPNSGYESLVCVNAVVMVCKLTADLTRTLASEKVELEQTECVSQYEPPEIA